MDSISSLKFKLEDMNRLEFPTPSSHCIYRVPPILRKMNQAAYTPTMVSIGPYHHGNERFKSMEEVKLWFLYKFLKRPQAKLFDDYVSAISDQEGQIRNCYSEAIPMERNEFVRMILTDACFMIEYFLLNVEENSWHSKLWSMDIREDLILLENQLPYFVLKYLFELTFPGGNGMPFRMEMPFELLTFDFVYGAFMYHIFSNKKFCGKFTFTYFLQHHLPKYSDGTPKVYHLCDMLRIFYVRLDQIPSDDSKMKPVYSVSKLHDAGIQFEVNEDEISLLKLKYSKGVLKIPRISITDSTETQFRNVVAFEQCHFPSTRSMTDYTILLEYLIKTGKDVEVLIEKGIIENIIGDSDAVASITKNLGRCTTYTSDFNGDYKSLFKELNKFCDSSCHKYKAIFKQQYWSTPWRIASFLGGILLLLLTLIQTISSIIALFQN